MVMVVDCVMASYEDEVLQIRDEVLKDVVDLRFIVRGNTDFRGKPAALPQYDHRKAHTKTVTATVPLPRSGNSWDLEHHLRDETLRVAFDRVDVAGAWYILADADEIPHPSALLPAVESRQPTLLRTDYRQWFMDWRAPDQWQLERQPLIGLWGHYRAEGGGSAARINAPKGWQRSRKVGWHFSTLGDEALAHRKLSTFSHTEFDTPEFTDPDALKERRMEGVDLLDRFLLEHTDDLPAAAARFPHLLAGAVSRAS